MLMNISTRLYLTRKMVQACHKRRQRRQRRQRRLRRLRRCQAAAAAFSESSACIKASKEQQSS